MPPKRNARTYAVAYYATLVGLPILAFAAAMAGAYLASLYLEIP